MHTVRTDRFHPVAMIHRRRMVLLVLFGLGCAINPVTGDRELALISEAQEIEMGRAGATEVAQVVGLHPDAALQAYVNRVGQAIAARGERPRLAWSFQVVDDAALNAFALPGGYVFITRGLLTHLRNESALASVLGHEAGHVTARHAVQQLSRRQVASVGLGIGSAVSPTIARYAPLASAGVGLMFLKYGRDDETEADRLGFRYALGSGYDIREMRSVFSMLAAASERSGAGRLPAWQSTHPDPGDRRRAIDRLISAAPQDFTALAIGEAEFLARVNGLVYGEDPRQGFFRDGKFLHPALAFQMRFPEGWTQRNAPDAVTAIHAAGDAVLELRLAAGSISEAAADFLSQEGIESGTPRTGSIHGNRAVQADFSAKDGEGTLILGAVTFIAYGGRTWRIVGYALQSRAASVRASFAGTAGSFAALTDRAVLAIRPQTVEVRQLARAMTLTQFNTEFPSGIPLGELALINGVTPTEPLRAGRRLKRVIGERLTVTATGSMPQR